MGFAIIVLSFHFLAPIGALMSSERCFNSFMIKKKHLSVSWSLVPPVHYAFPGSNSSDLVATSTSASEPCVFWEGEEREMKEEL